MPRLALPPELGDRFIPSRAAAARLLEGDSLYDRAQAATHETTRYLSGCAPALWTSLLAKTCLISTVTCRCAGCPAMILSGQWA